MNERIFKPGGYERLTRMIATAIERNSHDDWAKRDIQLIGETLLAVTDTPLTEGGLPSLLDPPHSFSDAEFTRERIEKMSLNEFLENEDKINAALRNNAIR